MAIKTNTPVSTDIQGNVDTSMPAGVKSLGNIGGLSTTQASGIQDIYKQKLASGLTPAQAQESIKADPAFAQAKAQYQASPSPATTPTNVGMQVATNTVTAPTVKETPVSAPSAPATTSQATVAPTTPTTGVKTQTNAKKDTSVDVPLINGRTQAEWNSSTGRELDITSNLINGTNLDPTLISNREGYNKAFSYETADAGKKAILDSFFKKGQLDQARQKTLSKYASYSPAELEGLLSTTLLPGREDYNTLMSDPVMKAKVDKANALRTIKNKTVDTTKVGEDLTADVFANNPSIKNAFESGSMSAEELKKLTQYVGQDTDEASLLAKKNKYDNAKIAYDDIENEVKKQLIGTGATSSDMAQIIANKQKDILPSLRVAESEYNNQYGQYVDRKKEALGLFDINLKQYNAEKEATAKIEADKTNFQQQKDIMDYQNKLSQANITTEKIVDPATGKTVLINSKTGDIVASYNTGLKSEAMTPYEQAQIDIKREETKAGKNINIQKIGENDYGYINSNGQLVKIGKEATSEIPTGTRDVTGYFNAVKAGVNDVYGSCGKFANDYSGVGSEPGGDDTIAGRTKTYTDTEPVVGGLVFFTGGGYDKTNGHVAVVTGRSADGKTITVKESNFHGDNKVTERTIPTTFVKGYYNNTPLATKTTGMAKEDYSDERIVNLLSVAPADSKKRVTWLAQNNLSENDYADYKAGSMPPTASQFKTISKTISDINALLSSPDITMATGVSGNFALPNTTAKDWQNKFNSLKAKLTLGNLGIMKGALSDKDMDMISKASSSINATGWNASSEQAIKDGLLEIKNSIINKENLSGLFASQKEQPTQPAQTYGKVDEKLKANIDVALKTTSKEEIIKQLKAKGIDPSIYGL